MSCCKQAQGAVKVTPVTACLVTLWMTRQFSKWPVTLFSHVILLSVSVLSHSLPLSLWPRHISIISLAPGCDYDYDMAILNISVQKQCCAGRKHPSRSLTIWWEILLLPLNLSFYHICSSLLLSMLSFPSSLFFLTWLGKLVQRLLPRYLGRIEYYFGDTQGPTVLSSAAGEHAGTWG